MGDPAQSMKNSPSRLGMGSHGMPVRRHWTIGGALGHIGLGSSPVSIDEHHYIIISIPD